MYLAQVLPFIPKLTHTTYLAPPISCLNHVPLIRNFRVSMLSSVAEEAMLVQQYLPLHISGHAEIAAVPCLAMAGPQVILCTHLSKTTRKIPRTITSKSFTHSLRSTPMLKRTSTMKTSTKSK